MQFHQRAYFRVPLDGLPCQFAVLRAGDKAVPERPIPAQMLNLGGGGLLLRSEIDLPIRVGLEVRVKFTLEDQEYDFIGRLVRKTDTLRDYEYGCEFVDAPERERQRLLEALNRVEMARRAALKARRENLR